MRAPQVVRELPAVGRRIAWGVTTEGLPLVATATHLFAGSTRLAWTDIERVSWKPSVLTLVEASEVEGSGSRHSWELAQDRRLAETVRAQVTSTIGWSERRALSPTGHVRLVGRRVPGEDPLRWQLVFEPGTDPADPRLRAQAEQLVDALRRTVG